MKSPSVLKLALILLASAGLAGGGYWLGMQQSGERAPMKSPAIPAGAAANGQGIEPKTGRKVLYWHDPMVPGQKFDKPGKSPFMDMQLVPVYADEGSNDSGIKVSPTLQQNLGIRFATARREETRESLEVVGTTQFDESSVEVLQSRVTGYIERLHARSPMQRIKRGEAVATLFVPDWIAPQEEYLALKRTGNDTLAEAARQRMRALSIPDGLVRQLDRSGTAQRSHTLRSPVNGVLTELAVRDGAMVSPGMTIARIASLDKVWLVAEVPEALSQRVGPGMTVEARSSGGERSYAGKVREILPGVNAATRTLQARLELDNRDGSLTPGLLMRVRLGADRAVVRLLVPTEAVIYSGKRAHVLVAGDNNAMQPVEVTTGREIGDDTEILTGLNEGQKVVSSGQFLIDSEASLKGVLPRLASANAPQNAPQTGPQTGQQNQVAQPAQKGTATVYRSVGKVEKVSPDAITFSHKPIPALQWPAMTMDFAKPRPDAFKDVQTGQDAEFSFQEKDGAYLLESVTPVGGGGK